MKNKYSLKKFIGALILIASLIIVFLAGYFYLANYTTFFNQVRELLGEIDQNVASKISWMFWTGIILFLIFIFYFSERKIEIIQSFLIDLLAIFSGALLLLGLFGPYIWEFKIYFIFSAFIIYYSSRIAKDLVQVVTKKLEKEKKENENRNN